MPTEPNVLFVLTDQQRWDALGAAGNDEIETPNLDQLAGEGIHFENCFVQAATCMPSRQSLFTGQYPSQLDSYTNGVPLPEDARTLPRLLDPAGYTTANVGALHFKPHANRDHRTPHPDYGFDRLELSEEPGCYPDRYRTWVRDRAPEALDRVSLGPPPAANEWPFDIGIDDINHPPPGRDRNHQPVSFEPGPELTHAAFVADRSIEFVRSASEPFCCVANIFAPHPPWTAPAEYLDLYDPEALSLPDHLPPEHERDPEYSDERLRAARQAYYAMVTDVDRQVGRVLEALESEGIADETLVIFTSDHGELLGEHGSWGKGWPGYEPASHVPLLVRWPEGVEDPGSRESGIVELTDLVPTILDCAGIQIPPDLLGQSIRPAFTGAFEGRSSALMEGSGGKTLRTDRYRYIVEGDGGEQFYDLETDPGERTDLSEDPEHVDALGEHRHELLQRLTALDLGTERDRTWPY
jgi:arylsulfatase A-like enzyme